MPLVDRVASESPSAKKVMLDLQVGQYHHDELYHREIARLSMHQRLNHMALHFSKYAGKVAAASDDKALIAIYTDVLIIALSSANVLNQELWTLLKRADQQHPSLLSFGRALALAMGETVTDRESLMRETVIATGRVAAACEKIDHLEQINYRSEIGAGVARLTELALAILSRQSEDPVEAIRVRLAEVKQRMKLHGRI